MQATESDDPLWVERHLSEILGELVGGRGVAQLASILNSLDDPLREMMWRGMFAESHLWIKAVVSPAMAATAASGCATPDASSMTKSECEHADLPGTEGHLHNLADFITLAFTQAVLGLHDYAHALSTNFPDWVTIQAHGKEVRNVGPLPAELLTNLRDGLKFENAVEGRGITSNANIYQLVARAVATETIDEASVLMKSFEDDLWPWARRVVDRDTLAAGAALSRLDEALRKWDTALAALSTLFQRCEAAHRDVDDRWPELSLDELASRRTELHEQLRAPIAKVATQVNVAMNPDWPDVFGWSFYRAHQDLLDDVLSDRSPARADLKERLSGLVHATDRAGDRLRTTVQRQHSQVLGSVWSEPLLMLLQLSGVALLTGRLRQRSDLIETFEHVWTRLLDTNAQGVLSSVYTALIMDDGLLGLTSGKIKRSARHQQVMASLESMGVSRDDVEFGDVEEFHPDMSTEVAAMLNHVAYGDFEDVFVAAFVVPEARQRGATLPDVDVGPRLRGLINAIAEARASEISRSDPAGSNVSNVHVDDEPEKL